MRKTRYRRAVIGTLSLGCTLLLAGLVHAEERPGVPEVLGPRFKNEPRAVETVRVNPIRRFGTAADTLRYWNQVAVDASGLDHTPVAQGENRVFGEQFGPGRASRAVAIVHIAIFDAVNAIVGGYRSYTGISPARKPASIDVAIARAAHDTLVAIFPSQAANFDELLEQDLRQLRVRDPLARDNGEAIGRRAAKAILAMRAGDHGVQTDPRMGTEYVPDEAAGVWRQDPISQSPIALGAHWGEVRPFVIRSGRQFRAPPPPAMTSEAYTAAYNEVKAVGSEASTVRTDDQTQTGIFWAYDGTPSLCAPPRLYNQIITQISGRSSNVIKLARLYALANTAMADAGIAIWESKFHYNLWRPVAGIRESDPGTGPSGTGDGNPLTVGDPTFSPLGAPASNLQGPNFTPPFPSYPSGHAGFGGALFQILRRFYGTDRVAFTFTSDELNGTTVDNQGRVRPLAPRSFESFSQAEEENGQSRIYLGIHWSFDKTEGIRQGQRVADYVYRNAFQPVSR
jgi:hypothetical protein